MRSLLGTTPPAAAGASPPAGSAKALAEQGYTDLTPVRPRTQARAGLSRHRRLSAALVVLGGAWVRQTQASGRDLEKCQNRPGIDGALFGGLQPLAALRVNLEGGGDGLGVEL